MSTMPPARDTTDSFTRRGLTASIGAVAAAFAASICCVGPLLFVTLGVGAGIASQMEPVRPLFTALAVGLLLVGFYTVYGRGPAPADESTMSCAGPAPNCALPRNRSREKVVLWTATVLAVVFLTFPQWSLLLV